MRKIGSGNFEYFTDHWKKQTNVAYASTKVEVARKFLQIMDDIHKNPALVLDSGCGDGVHASAINDSFGDKVLYFGVDISLPAIITARKRNCAAAFFCGDIQEMPLKDEIFDVSFSYGALAYATSPKKAFDELCRVTRSGGLVGVWFYFRPKGLPWIALKLVRKIAQLSPKPIVGILANLIVPLLIVLPTASKVNLFNSSWMQCKEIVMVNIAPSIWFPNKCEVVDLFSRNGIEIVSFTELDGAMVWGRKK